MFSCIRAAFIVVVFVVFALFAPGAFAQGPCVVPMQPCSWAATCPQPAYTGPGVPDIRIVNTADIERILGVENRTPFVSSLVTCSLSRVRYEYALDPLFVNVIETHVAPIRADTRVLPGFDGVTDFSGLSGRTLFDTTCVVMESRFTLSKELVDIIRQKSWVLYVRAIPGQFLEFLGGQGTWMTDYNSGVSVVVEVIPPPVRRRS